MATYTGMSLGGEVRESISLDEDDLSDVEDEVFIRDGKNSYKLAEELNVKRPLMAPRRKHGKGETSSRLKSKHTCRAFCRPCCYIFTGLSIIIALIILVIILVSMYPLPLDRLRDWILSRPRPVDGSVKLLPCTNLKVIDIWTINLPKLTTESPVKTLDVNKDGVEDILFGFGTGDNYHTLPADIFCPVFMGVPPPCEGGVVALNGTDGNILWRHWINDTIFFLQCTADINADGLNDCLAIGSEGTITVINAKNGSTIWRINNNKMDVYLGNFIPDQNNDKIPDILTSHTSRDSRGGHLFFISGKNGDIIKDVSMANGERTYFMPQLLDTGNGSYSVLYGTGSPSTPGSLMISSLESLMKNNATPKVLYQDNFKGMLSQAIFVDITNDGRDDIVIGMYNSTTVAFDGITYKQIWNFTVPNSESNVLPTPAFFNDDNITDFLIIYEKYDNILNYNFTEAYIIDGKSGKSFYEKPISGSIRSQLGGITLSMESFGFDMFLYWTLECASGDMHKKHFTSESGNFFDYCQRFNTSSIIKLNALSQYDEPPGLEVYSSLIRSNLEFNNSKTPVREIMDYLHNHPNFEMPRHRGQVEVDEDPIDFNKEMKIRKYGSSSFRHKLNNPGIVKDYMGSSGEDIRNPILNEALDYDSILNTFPEERSQYGEFSSETNENPSVFEKPVIADESKSTSRDPRSRRLEIVQNNSTNNDSKSSSIKKNLSDGKYGIYGFKNVRLAKNDGLLHDLNRAPTKILKDTYFKNRESQLKKSRFEQRDINSHKDKIKDNTEVQQTIEHEKNLSENLSTTLWDLESEKEAQEKNNGYYRLRRQIDTSHIIRKITSSGAVVQPIFATNNSIDIVFITYWQPQSNGLHQANNEIQNCIEGKLLKASEDKDNTYQKTTLDEQKALFETECDNDIENFKNEFGYFEEINQLNLGQMTVYRVRVECYCDSVGPSERCAKFLPAKLQSWPSYLGWNGDGVYKKRT